MGRNRYVDETGGAKGYSKVLDLCPANVPLRIALAEEIKSIADRMRVRPTIIDLGCGPGDSAIPIMNRIPEARYILVDEDPDMLRGAEEQIQLLKERLEQSGGSVEYIEAPMDRYLAGMESMNPESLILTSSWAIHNFQPEEQEASLRAVADRLTSGQYFVLMDKVYPDEYALQRVLLEEQKKLYKYLPDEQRQAMLEHEDADFAVKMTQTEILVLFERFHFYPVIEQRVARDILVVAKKW